MNKLLKRKREELFAYHYANGFINIKRLLNGVRIVVKTLDEVYELEVGTAERAVVLLASNIRFECRDKAVVLGSLDPETHIFLPQIIGQGLRIVLRPRKGKVISTGPVISARIVGSTYTYELWGGE